MKLIVGLVDKLTTDYGLRTTADKKHRAEVGKGEIEGRRTVIAKPQTYMNSSGESVQALLSFYKLKPDNLVVIHDDKDIPLGEIRVQQDRGAAGHNGVLSIIEHLGTKDFLRIRVGVAPTNSPLALVPSFETLRGPQTLNGSSSRGEGGSRGVLAIGDTANFVLGKFTKEEQKVLKEVVEKVIENIKQILKEY